MYSCIYLYHDIGGSDVPSSADPLLDFNCWVSKARTNYISVQMFFDLDEKEKPAREKNTVANIGIDLTGFSDAGYGDCLDYEENGTCPRAYTSCSIYSMI